MAVEGVMVSYNYSDGELANILTVSASGIKFSNRWVLTHGSILSPLKEAKVIQNSKGKPILNDAFYENLPEIHVTCEKNRSKNANVCESVERLSRDRDSSEFEHSSYQIRVLTGRICHVWQCPILDRCVDDILYSWTIGHRDGDVEKQTQLGKALLSVFVLVDLYSGDRGLQLKQKWRNIRDCFVKSHKAKQTGDKKRHEYAYYENLMFLANANEPLSANEAFSPPRPDLSEPDDDEQDSNTAVSWPIDRQIKTECFETNAQEDNDSQDSCLSWCQRNTQSKYRDEDVSSERKRQRPTTQTEKPYTDEDDDRLFFLSLVGDFKKVPEALKLQTKLNILKVIQAGQCSNGLQY